MDMMRGLMSAFVLTVWLAGWFWVAIDPGWTTVFFLLLASVGLVGWLLSLPESNPTDVQQARDGAFAPKVNRRKNRYWNPRN